MKRLLTVTLALIMVMSMFTGVANAYQLKADITEDISSAFSVVKIK